MVDDAAALEADSTGGQQVGADDNGDAIISKVLGAVSSGQDPAGADDGRAAEMVSVGTTQRGQVRELARLSVLSTHNA